MESSQSVGQAEMLGAKSKGKSAKGGPPPKGKGKGGYVETKFSLDDLAPDELDFYNRFGMHKRTAALSGSFALEIFISGRTASSSPLSAELRCQGCYSFDESTGQLSTTQDSECSCEAQQFVATFSADAIAQEPFPEAVFESAGDVEMPCIQVISSEIMREIQNPDNSGAYFVLPSQQNGAEYPSHTSVVTMIDDYKFDQTAGPAGQLAVHPAVGQFLLDNARNSFREFGISSVVPVLDAANRILRDSGYTEKKSEFQSINGYLKMPVPQDLEEGDTMLASWRGNLHKYRQILMEDVLASGLTPSKGAFSQCSHRVNLIYASAVPINCYVNGIGIVSKSFGDDELRKFQSKVAQSALVVQYYAALKAAVKHRNENKTKVFLLALGGGAFKNALQDIARAMSIAVEMLDPCERELLDIRMLAYHRQSQSKDVNTESSQFVELLSSLKKLRVVAP